MLTQFLFLLIFLFMDAPHVLWGRGSVFLPLLCHAVFIVLSSFAIILMTKRELFALLRYFLVQCVAPIDQLRIINPP